MQVQNNPFLLNPTVQQRNTATVPPVYIYQQPAQPKYVMPNIQHLQAQTVPYINNTISKVQTNITKTPFIHKAQPVSVKTDKAYPWKNDLRKLFHENKAVIYALIIRTFNAKDKDGDSLVDKEKGEEVGTFLNAIDRLDELKSLGVNTLHMLPINPPGHKNKLGKAGSIYAPLDYSSIDPALDDPKAPTNVYEEAKLFVNECHKRGIRVMLDLPSCASVDLFDQRPDLMSVDALNRPKVPGNWEDIRTFKPWQDEEKKILNEPLYKEYKKFVDMCLDLGIDGIRADVARAKPPEFWDRLIKYTRSKDPNFAYLAETYTYEDASPMANIPADRPEDLLRVGFDSYYGQYHIFHSMQNATEILNYVLDNLKMSQNLPPNKSLIGSFTTHDDISPMNHGGIPYCNLTTGLQSTLPMTNPYFISGYESGDWYDYAYGDKEINGVFYKVNSGMIDIFNNSRKPGGKNPEAGKFMSNIMKVRKQYEDVITKGSFIPLKVSENKNDQIIAYARHYNGKTLLIVANKDVNNVQTGKISIPGMKPNQQLKDLATSYGIPSKYAPDNNAMLVELGPARFHVFEIDTKNIEKNSNQVYRQNLTNNTFVNFFSLR